MSKLLRYVGIHEDVFIPALDDAYVPRNGTLLVDSDEMADRMLEQDGWVLADAVAAELKKAELLQLADEHGVEVPGSATKADIVAALPPEALPVPVPVAPAPVSALAPEGPA